MKKFLILLSCLLVLFPIYIKAEEVENETSENQIPLAQNAKSAILIDASTGQVLFEKNSHEKLAPASMTKIMSMLVIVESIEKGIIHWDDMVTASSNASGMGGSQILLETGEQMKVEDMFKGVAVASGNDAVVALAEAVAGTTDEFVKMMNQKVKELGLKDTNFKNPHGLDEANHYSSAYDMAMIARELVKYEKVLTFTSIYEDYLRKGTSKEFWLVNTNKLVRFYNGVDGLKTGYTKEAGYCLTATAKKNDLRLISVVMGEETNGLRSSETSSILDYGFAQYKSTELVKKGDVVAEVEVEKAKKQTVSVITKENASILMKKTEKMGEITYEPQIDKIKAPVKVGDKVGILNVKEDGKLVKQVDLTVKEDIKEANILELYIRYLSDLAVGNIKF
ncbi:D-alanyl-D-alanine carboxypeptidase [bacterium]|nr:D-alanyl-D-alanine carboxypeptidase [bacterium]